MAERKGAKRAAQKTNSGFTDEERAAMKERVRELKGRTRSAKPDGETELLEKIAEMQGADRTIAERLHAIVKAHAPSLGSRTWYGMPAYTKDNEVLCFFQPSGKFKVRYSTLGFSDEAKLDEGHMWPIAYSLTELGAAEESEIIALLKRAIG